MPTLWPPAQESDSSVLQEGTPVSVSVGQQDDIVRSGGLSADFPSGSPVDSPRDAADRFRYKYMTNRCSSNKTERAGRIGLRPGNRRHRAEDEQTTSALVRAPGQPWKTRASAIRRHDDFISICMRTHHNFAEEETTVVD